MTERILRPREVEELLGVSESTLYRYSRNGNFPAPIKLSPRRRGWPKSVVEEWLREKDAGVSQTVEDEAVAV